jgi:hypothetical protein
MDWNKPLLCEGGKVLSVSESFEGYRLVKIEGIEEPLRYRDSGFCEDWESYEEDMSIYNVLTFPGYAIVPRTLTTNMISAVLTHPREKDLNLADTWNILLDQFEKDSK